MTITFSVEKSKGEKLREVMKRQGEPIIRQKLAEYVQLLKEEFSQGLILPTKSSTNTTNTPSATSINNSRTYIAPQIPTTEKTSPTITYRDLKINDKFKCSKTELFTTFCDVNKVKAFTQNSVSKYDPRKGGFFSLFSDNITGRFLDIVPYDRIEMLWRFKSWPSDHYSHVVLTFNDDTDQTKITIEQKGVPSHFYDNTMVCNEKNVSTCMDKFLFFCFENILGWLETLLLRKYQVHIWLWITATVGKLDSFSFYRIDSFFFINKFSDIKNKINKIKTHVVQLNSSALHIFREKSYLTLCGDDPIIQMV